MQSLTMAYYKGEFFALGGIKVLGFDRSKFRTTLPGEKAGGQKKTLLGGSDQGHLLVPVH